MRGISQTSAVLLCFVIWVSQSDPCLAQSTPASSSLSSSKSNSQAADKEFAEKFWRYLRANNYKQWSPAPGKTASHFAGRNAASGTVSPHGDFAKTYVNRTAAGRPDSLPVGSILIMENYGQDRSLKTISVMYRTPDYNPAANDWFWVNYNPDGSVASAKAGGVGMTDREGVRQASAAVPLAKMLVGRSVSCIECHKSGGGGDLAFLNDKSYTQAVVAPRVATLPKASLTRSPVTTPTRKASATRKAKVKSKPKVKIRRPTTVNKVWNQNVVIPSPQGIIIPCPT